jgi:hypothetical protein
MRPLDELVAGDLDVADEPGDARRERVVGELHRDGDGESGGGGGERLLDALGDQGGIRRAVDLQYPERGDHAGDRTEKA